MVLFENMKGELKYVKGIDDSGTAGNASLELRLVAGRRYVLRIRHYVSYESSQSAVMLW